ncbi:MAG: hypothetical protein ACK4X1_00055 [Terricaulis sp.]
MSAELDRLLGRLRARKADAPLDQMELRVWGRIDALRDKPTAGWALRGGLAACALLLGLIVGGDNLRAARADASPFEIRAAYTPSTLLGGTLK